MDKKTLTLLRQGDPHAFEDLVRENQNKVFRVAYSMLHHEEDAQDISQDVFLKVYNALPNFNGQSDISTWIYRITYNTCLDFLKKNGQKVALTKTLDDVEDQEVQNIESSIFLPEESFERQELSSDLRAALAELPEDQRVLIEMKDMHGFSYEEIMAMTGAKEGTVKSRLNRGRVALKKILVRKWGLDGEVQES